MRSKEKRLPGEAQNAMTAAPTERRRHPRVRLEGSVEFACASEPYLVVTGCLVDVSSGGFRASHAHLKLTSGEKVRFRHPLASGGAVVAWTRLVNSRA